MFEATAAAAGVTTEEAAAAARILGSTKNGGGGGGGGEAWWIIGRIGLGDAKMGDEDVEVGANDEMEVVVEGGGGLTLWCSLK